MGRHGLYDLGEETFTCPECGKVFEQVPGFRMRDELYCPKCGKEVEFHIIDDED